MCRLINQGNGFVMVRFGVVFIMSCYISPNVHRNKFLEFLDNLSLVINSLKGKFLIGGDFNAWSELWGSQITDRRGELVERWSAAYDIRLLNIGNVATCVRPQGSSVIDLTWVSSDLL